MAREGRWLPVVCSPTGTPTAPGGPHSPQSWERSPPRPPLQCRARCCGHRGALRLAGLRVTRDITHQLRDPRSRHLAGGRLGGEPGQCSWNRGTKCGAGSPIPNNGDTTVPSLRPLGTFTRESLLHLRVAQRGPEGHVNQEELIQVFPHLPSGSFLTNPQGSCLIVPPNVGQRPMRFQIGSWGQGQGADVSMSGGGAWTSVSPTDSVPKSLLTASLGICKVTGLGEQFTVVIGLGHPMGGDE